MITTVLLSPITAMIIRTNGISTRILTEMTSGFLVQHYLLLPGTDGRKIKEYRYISGFILKIMQWFWNDIYKLPVPFCCNDRSHCSSILKILTDSYRRMRMTETIIRILPGFYFYYVFVKWIDSFFPALLLLFFNKYFLLPLKCFARNNDLIKNHYPECLL